MTIMAMTIDDDGNDGDADDNDDDDGDDNDEPCHKLLNPW